MKDFVEIVGIYEHSFRVNIYTIEPFRIIGLIDVDIQYDYGKERVTLAYYRSSGTNSGKINGLWYPIVGIKLHTGEFREFTKYLNHVLSRTTKNSWAEKGWLAKSLFFSGSRRDKELRGFSYGIHQEKLYQIGDRLTGLYNDNRYSPINHMDARYINSVLTLNKKQYNNRCTQRYNYERFIRDVYKGLYENDN
ncbi:MAG: hypothetical protein K0S04_3389 [Herbinix sp.]|jgi:hypothetical protein|nr:hypothetical protein [Herbinix sp.]